MLSDVELPMPASDDASLETYLAGLEALRAAAGAATLVIPGHGTPSVRPSERFDADLRYLDDLLAGRRPRDLRIDDPQNADLHAQNVRRARVSRSPS
jgi:glyoxylase-like metal-dependent hydrolase (beta-lactamase superfamily II)